MTQPDPPQEKTCAETATLRTLSAEQLRKLLNDHRNNLQKRLFELKQSAMRLEKDIANIDDLLAELTTG